VLPTRLPLERFYERVAALFGHPAANTRFTWPMVRGAVRLALRGDLWCMREVYGAVKELREPAAYLEPPVRVRAPRQRQAVFATT
jgi:hypothetical protein